MSRLIIIIAILSSLSCSEESIDKENGKSMSHRDLIIDYWQWYHQTSNMIYDGNGEWGRSHYGFRDVLRNTYWRGESYGMLAETNSPDRDVYRELALEAAGFILKAQNEGNTGVFGVPNESNHPEFGAEIRLVNDTFPEGIQNGWISILPEDFISELYYDHGYSLAFISREYTRSQKPTLLPAIDAAASWFLRNQVGTKNENYLSAISKGLCYAFEATDNPIYLQAAKSIHLTSIFPSQQPDGKWDDSHNRRLVYHSFITSGLLALKKVLPDGDPVEEMLDNSFELALKAFIDEINSSEITEFSGIIEGWPGSCILTLIELSEFRPLDAEETRALEKVANYLVSNRQFIENNLHSPESAILLRLSAPIGMYAATLIEK